MPDLPSRFTHEHAITAALTPLLARQRELLANQPGAVDWLSFESRVRETLRPLLATVYVEAASGLITEQGLGFDLRDFEAAGEVWATRQAEMLATVWTGNLQADAREAVERAHVLAKEQVNQTFAAHLAAILLLLLSDERAYGLAITETTRAISTGEFAAVRAVNSGAAAISGAGQTGTAPTGGRIGQPGQPLTIPGKLTLAGIWTTERDSRVCPICRPLDQTREPVWGRQFPSGPPAHPRCRCYLIWEAGRSSEQ